MCYLHLCCPYVYLRRSHSLLAFRRYVPGELGLPGGLPKGDLPPLLEPLVDALQQGLDALIPQDVKDVRYSGRKLYRVCSDYCSHFPARAAFSPEYEDLPARNVRRLHQNPDAGLSPRDTSHETGSGIWQRAAEPLDRQCMFVATCIWPIRRTDSTMCPCHPLCTGRSTGVPNCPLRNDCRQ